LAFANGKGDIVDRLNAAEMHFEILNFNHGLDVGRALKKNNPLFVKKGVGLSANEP
jgi:hypothetical protein